MPNLGHSSRSRSFYTCLRTVYLYRVPGHIMVSMGCTLYYHRCIVHICRDGRVGQIDQMLEVLRLGPAFVPAGVTDLTVS